MNRRTSEGIFSRQSLAGAAVPPRDPTDDEDDDREPAVIREPDED